MTTPTDVKAAFNWNPITEGSVTSFVGMYEPGFSWSFEETVARLKALSGQDPTAGTDGYTVSVEFVGTFKGIVFTLYDYRGNRALHIGGGEVLRKDPQNVVVLCKALDAALMHVTPAEYEAVVHYDEVAGTRHGWPEDALPDRFVRDRHARVLDALAGTQSNIWLTDKAVAACKAGAAALRAQEKAK